MFGSFSMGHWLIVLLIVALVFGTRKLRDLGGDLGHAIKGFKEGLRDGERTHSVQRSISTLKNGTQETPASHEAHSGTR